MIFCHLPSADEQIGDDHPGNESGKPVKERDCRCFDFIFFRLSVFENREENGGQNALGINLIFGAECKSKEKSGREMAEGLFLCFCEQYKKDCSSEIKNTGNIHIGCGGIKIIQRRQKQHCPGSEGVKRRPLQNINRCQPDEKRNPQIHDRRHRAELFDPECGLFHHFDIIPLSRFLCGEEGAENEILHWTILIRIRFHHLPCGKGGIRGNRICNRFGKGWHCPGNGEELNSEPEEE